MLQWEQNGKLTYSYIFFHKFLLCTVNIPGVCNFYKVSTSIYNLQGVVTICSLANTLFIIAYQAFVRAIDKTVKETEFSLQRQPWEFNFECSLECCWGILRIVGLNCH